MESKVWWHGCECFEALEGTGRRESPLEANVCRPEPRTQGIEGHCRKKAIKPGERRELSKYAIQQHGLSERQACKIVNVSRSVVRYEARKQDEQELSNELLAVAGRKPRWGFGKMADYLRNKGFGWNRKRIYRVYYELRLNLRAKPKKRLPKRTPQVLSQPEAANQSWSLDFMGESLASGRAFRTLNILDDFNREVLWIEVDTSLLAECLVRILETLIAWRGCPTQIRMDNGPELIVCGR
jgi:putative transposase